MPAPSPRGGTFANSLRRLMRKPSARRSKSGTFSSLPVPSSSIPVRAANGTTPSRTPIDSHADEFGNLDPLTPKRENASLPATSPAKSVKSRGREIEKSPSRSSRILSPFRARDNPSETSSKIKSNGKGKQKSKSIPAPTNESERERNGIADAFEDDIWQSNGLEKKEMEYEETDTETELPHLWDSSRTGESENRVGLGEGPLLRQRNETADANQDASLTAQQSSVRSATSPSRGPFGSLRSGGDRSLTLQALSPTTTRLGQGLASPIYHTPTQHRSPTSTPTRGKEYNGERRGSLASGLSEEAGMGVALTLGQDSTSQLGEFFCDVPQTVLSVESLADLIPSHSYLSFHRSECKSISSSLHSSFPSEQFHS